MVLEIRDCLLHWMKLRIVSQDHQMGLKEAPRRGNGRLQPTFSSCHRVISSTLIKKSISRYVNGTGRFPRQSYRKDLTTKPKMIINKITLRLTLLNYECLLPPDPNFPLDESQVTVSRNEEQPRHGERCQQLKHRGTPYGDNCHMRQPSASSGLAHAPPCGWNSFLPSFDSWLNLTEVLIPQCFLIALSHLWFSFSAEYTGTQEAALPWE
ncbi:uncharacterized protein LOC134478152 isoform X3 [Cavia porcellus]|uniref:uncharacterized protein LOC134478152 isoform X3 n=1 Tax=Cavia porcellus TaxID=10141 RepID=UPI002FE122D6